MPNRRQAWLRMAAVGAVPLAASGLHLLARNAPEPGNVAKVAAPPRDVCIFSPTFAWDGHSGGSMLAARAVPNDARCPVCGMFPARQPRWAVQVIYADGHAHFLDSPLSLFHYLQHVKRYAPGRRRAEISAIHVSEHESGRWLAAELALYIHGSTLVGPMGNGNLPATTAGEAASRLIERVGGQVLSFASLEGELPALLQALAPHSH